MITELQKVNLSQARQLKKLGFDWPVHGSYTEYITEEIHPEDGASGPFGWEKEEVTQDSDYFMNNNSHTDYSNDNYIMYACPTVALALKWIQQKYNIYFTIRYTCSFLPTVAAYFTVDEVTPNSSKTIQVKPEATHSLNIFWSDSFPAEEIESAALDWALNYLIDKQ